LTDALKSHRRAADDGDRTVAGAAALDRSAESFSEPFLPIERLMVVKPGHNEFQTKG
jgi:hypothetical protein